jgi:hypothetical protein
MVLIKDLYHYFNFRLIVETSIIDIQRNLSIQNYRTLNLYQLQM